MPIDRKRIEDAITEILLAIGEYPEREGLKDTPARVAAAYQELFYSEECKMRVFPNKEKYDQFIIAKDIIFYSFCEHHLLPFYGTVTVGYLPDCFIVGLSKIVRLVQQCASRLQLQEKLTQEIAYALENALNPIAVGVIVEASHLCMAMRGVRTPQHKTITSAMLGECRTDPSVRNEFLELTKC